MHIPAIHADQHTEPVLTGGLCAPARPEDLGRAVEALGKIHNLA